MQERAAMLGAGRNLAPALLFFGCRTPETDDLYRDELDRWEKMGAVEVRRAYSRAVDKSLGCKYVQDRLYHDREEVLDLWDKGAKVFVCGSREVGKAIEEVCVKLVVESGERYGKVCAEEEAREWWGSVRNERYATDVFD
jgi:cytochrome P450 / NADPH-cytochrome P450 reductase